MNDCIFCKIVDKEIPAEIVYENEEVVAFNDINPQAPVHVLIIPKKHIPTLNNIVGEQKKLIGEILLVAQKIAREKGIAERGYRTVFNCNADAGQDVFHIHLHLLGGRKMTWPPG
ncbi:MAG: histidine triad nucleotide-binding protein [FCB group bacterium]|nr:histidine triad nucleotide-binding protein [FCB group bacterium]